MKVTFEETIVKKRTVTKEVSNQEYILIRIRQIRKEKKIMQEDFAKKLGLSRTSISNIELGRQGISIEMLERICKALQCKSTDLLPF